MNEGRRQAQQLAQGPVLGYHDGCRKHGPHGSRLEVSLVPEISRKSLAILRVLDSAGEAMGAGAIAEALEAYGVDLTERAVRYHLERLDELGYTEGLGRSGRRITEKGKKEVAQAHVSDKVGLVNARLEALAYQTDFDINTGRGSIVINISHIPTRDATRALGIMRAPIASRFCTSRKLAVVGPGERIGDHIVPDRMVGFGTVCSVTINGILYSEGIPVRSMFGGLLAVESYEPTRFVDLVNYGATSLDPLEIFIKSARTSVAQAASRGAGIIGAGFREFPAVAREHVLDVVDRAARWGMHGVLAVGGPSQPLTEAQVGLGRCGMVVAAGLNAIAAVEESRITSESKAMETLVEYEALADIDNARIV